MQEVTDFADMGPNNEELLAVQVIWALFCVFFQKCGKSEYRGVVCCCFCHVSCHIFENAGASKATL